jgi:hypothetical protein
MLIFKNLFSFYVEFEILLHFLLFCRLLNVNKDVNMRNDAWNEMGWTYTKKLSEKHFWTKFADRNYGISSLVRSDKKVQKLRTAIFRLAARTYSFKAIFSLELIDFDTPSSQTSLNWLEKRSKARKKRKNTIEERFEGELKNRARNHRYFWCILFFTLFSYCTVV